jgi:prepilin-type N-terminal cleavage/methylation domain-containing protein
MKKKKQKGFTLVEVIAALGILTTGVTIIYAVFTFANTTWVKEKNSLELFSSNQSIAQSLKTLGKTNMKELVEANSDTDNADVYIYFDNYDDLSIDLSSFKKATVSSDFFTDCVNQNTGKKKYGAHLKIIKHNLTTSGYTDYDYYEVDETVWNLSLTTEINSQSNFYIGR